MTEPQSAPAAPPFFIVGCVRSGTTLLQTLMDAHPEIAIPTESLLFTRFSGVFRHYGDLRQRANLALLVRDLLTDERIRRWKLAVSVDAFCRELSEPTLWRTWCPMPAAIRRQAAVFN